MTDQLEQILLRLRELERRVGTLELSPVRWKWQSEYSALLADQLQVTILKTEDGTSSVGGLLQGHRKNTNNVGQDLDVALTLRGIAQTDQGADVIAADIYLQMTDVSDGAEHGAVKIVTQDSGADAFPAFFERDAVLFGATSSSDFGTNHAVTSKLQTIYTPATLSLSAGDNHDIFLGNATFYRITAPTSGAFAITSFQGGTDGRIIIIRTIGTATLTIKDNTGSGTVENRILTGTGGDLALGSLASIVLVYDLSRWRVVSARGSSGAF